MVLALAAAPIAQAQTSPAEVLNLELQNTDEGLFVYANVRLELPAVVEDALNKGVAMYFVAEAEVRRTRWYWTDKTVFIEARHMRLAYQPLTRRWRLNVSAQAFTSSGQGVTLSQYFDSLPEALSTVARIARWKIAEPSVLTPDTAYSLDFRFHLDLTQLPRPFQIGALGQSDWSLSTNRRLQLVLDAPK